MAFRYREKDVLIFGLAIISLICFSSLLYLPSGDDVLLRTRHLVRRAENRLRAAESYDREILRDKIEKANIPAPPLPPVETQDTNVDETLGNELAQRRDFIKQMTKFGWDGYRKYAWGSNELKPVSKQSHRASVFGSGDIGATIVDAIDTLYIMGLNEEYQQAKDWISSEFDIMKAEGEISVFETNIRFVGGLLAIYALTNDSVFLKKAQNIADILLPAFNTATGIPLAVIDLRLNRSHNWPWASGGCSILSEFGSLHLEFEYLSRCTNNTIYSEKVARIREVLSTIEKPKGLYPNYLNPETGKWGLRHISVGALGDSFYEYLLKSWVLSNRKDDKAKEMYDSAVRAIKDHLLRYSKPNNLTYFAEMKGSRVEDKMDHLACFIAGMFALEAIYEEDQERRSEALQIAEQIGNTCHESYIRSETGLGPESFRFTSDVEAAAVSEREKYYIERPEVIEGWYYLWKATNDTKYREWCWQAAQAIEKYCRANAGYSGIRNVYTKNVDLDDVQQSFIFAETFKYLYLVFSDDSVMPLKKWVFNTEAHAFPIFY